MLSSENLAHLYPQFVLVPCFMPVDRVEVKDSKMPAAATATEACLSSDTALGEVVETERSSAVPGLL